MIEGWERAMFGLMRKLGGLGAARRGATSSAQVAPSGPARNEVIRGALTVHRIGSLEELSALRAELNALNARSRQADPFSTCEFFENFLRHDELDDPKHPRELWFLVAFDGDRLAGYLALRRGVRKALGVSTGVLEVVALRDGDRPHVVALPEDEQRCTQAFWDYLASQRRHWSYLELHQQDASSTFWPLAHGQAPSGYYGRPFPCFENATIPIRWGSFAEYIKASSSNQRSALSRGVRTLLGAGELTFLYSEDPAVTPALFELYESVERRSWKAVTRGNIGRHQKRREFYKTMLSPDYPLRIGIDILLLDGVPIAGVINGFFRGRQHLLTLCYEHAKESISPGRAVLLLGIRRAIERGCRAYNLGSGSGYYKKRFLAELTETGVVQVFRMGSPFFWKAMLGELRRLGKRQQEQAEYNLVKRAAEEEGATKVLTTIMPSREELARLAARVEEAKAKGCEVLDNAGFAAAMPFGSNAAKVARPEVKPPQRKKTRRPLLDDDA
jgi:CelD/BcsL family acetyltransferase involved in cellulose biosynthesis